MRALVSLALLLAASQGFAKGATERTGDALEFVLPGVAFAATALRHDGEGAGQHALALATTMAGVYSLKHLIDKGRPEGQANDSFPSAHTAVSMQSAVFMHRRYGLKWAMPMYVGAAWVGHSRVHARRHDEQDVLAGALIGGAASYFFTTEYRVQNQSLTVAPAIGADFVGVHITLSGTAR